MRKILAHICIQLTSIVLIAALFAPMAVKLSHAVYEHREQLCHKKGAVHIHEIELDCDFQKFNLAPQLYTAIIKVPQKITPFSFHKSDSSYSFFNKYQKLHFTLRGPPVA